MPGKGREVSFYGAFATKAKAKARERRIPGAYIQVVKVRGQRRYVVLTRKGR